MKNVQKNIWKQVDKEEVRIDEKGPGESERPGHVRNDKETREKMIPSDDDER